MNPNLTIGLLLSEKDFHLFKPWLANHDGIASEIVIGIDGDLHKFHWEVNDGPDFDSARSLVWAFSVPLNNDFAGARNTILENCKTSFMLFLDADELLVPSTKERLSQHLHDIEYSSVEAYSFERLNVFNRTFQDYPNYHACLVRADKIRYVNSSPEWGAKPGCHEVPCCTISNGVVKTSFQILHLKENWTGNFRHKGYTDKNNEMAMTDVERKVKATQYERNNNS